MLINYELKIYLLLEIFGLIFLKAILSFKNYSIEKEKYEAFWKAMEMRNDQKFSEDIKDLIDFVLSYKFNKQKKWNFQEFLNDQAWFKGMNSKENEDYFKEKLKKLEDPEETGCLYNFHEKFGK